MKRTIEQVPVTGQRVLMRVDFNVPLGPDGAITDDRRIRLALPGIRSVVERGGRLVLMSHLGRPSGAGHEPSLCLRPAAERLRELLDGPAVAFVDGDCAGPEAAAAVDSMDDGQVVVLDNLRFDAGEKKGDPSFAARLAALGDVYCNDAFGTAHRADASMVAVPQAMAGRPRVAGLLLERELRYLSGALADPAHPFVAVLGGAKVSDKLGAIRNLAGRVDTILVGGAMAYTFLSAQGVDVGASRVERDMLQTARRIGEEVDGAGSRLVLPSDHVAAQSLDAGAPTRVFEGAIEAGWIGLDIGPASARDFAAMVAEARTFVWNGPVGVFETPPYDAGSRQIGEAAVDATGRGATSIVGGGDTAAAVEAFGLADGFSHVSTGGGASLQMLEGRRFESVELLDDA